MTNSKRYRIDFYSDRKGKIGSWLLESLPSKSDYKIGDEIIVWGTKYKIIKSMYEFIYKDAGDVPAPDHISLEGILRIHLEEVSD